MNCYITDANSGSIYPNELDKDNTLFYPERRMTTHDQLNTGRPEHFHIVTDSHFLVGLYSRHEVFYWKDGEWINPDFQTYGCSYNIILMDLWYNEHTIPQAVVDGNITNVMGHKIKED